MFKKHKNVCDQIQALVKREDCRASDLLEIVNSAEFKAFTDDLFNASSDALSAPEPSQDYFISEIIQYTIGTIKLYVDAIPHNSIQAIRLHFDPQASGQEIQPQIELQFDTGTYHIDIGELWRSEIELEPKQRKEMEIMAESIWFEYCDSGFSTDRSALVDEMQKAVGKQFPTAEVNCFVKQN